MNYRLQYWLEAAFGNLASSNVGNNVLPPYLIEKNRICFDFLTNLLKLTETG